MDDGGVQSGSASEFMAQNEMRTIRAQLESAREEIQTLRVRSANARMSHELELRSQLNTAREASQRALEQAVAEARDERRSDAFKSVQEEAAAAASKVGSSADVMVINTGLSPDHFFGNQHHRDVRVLEQLAMRNGSLRARDAIALSATHLSLGFHELMRIVRAADAGFIQEENLACFDVWRVRSILSLARVVADQNLLESDPHDAAALYRFALTVFGWGRWDRGAKLVFSELLLHLGHFEEALTAISRSGLESDRPVQAALVQANVARARSSEHHWLDALNALYRAGGFVEIRLRPGPEDRLSRLETLATEPADGPLISVVMPTHNGAEYIEAAIRSVLGQSWSNLELIVVDDGSDEANRHALDSLAATHGFRLLRHERPLGAYQARMAGFDAASGEFFTVHDDDDWSHPQKLETQVKHLLANPAVTANMSYMVRIDDQGDFLRINDNPEWNQRNYSSLMIRRDDVTRFGMWDVLNRGADAEFHDRLKVLTGAPVAAVEGPPLSFMRARSGSLTSGEIRRGALDFGRQTYGLLYGEWHARLAEMARDERRAEIEVFRDRARQCFSVPANFKPGNRRIRPNEFEVVYCTDLRFPGGNSSLTSAELRATAARGRRVAVMHVASPILRAPRPMHPGIAEVVREYDIPVIALEDEVLTDLLILRNPSILQYADGLRTCVRARESLIVANSAPMGLNGLDANYDVEECLAHAEAAFGSPVSVAPESPQTRDLLQRLSPGLELSPDDWPGFLPDHAIASAARLPGHHRPVVGRHSRDHPLKWPDTVADLEAAYVGGAVFATRVMGGADAAPDPESLMRPGVEVLGFGALPVADYLRTIDFWVYMHSRDLVESFGMAIIEAMAAGCVVILPHYLEPLFGDAAVYAEPAQVRGIVHEMWSAPDRYRAQSERGLQTVRSRFSESAYAETIDRFLQRGRG